MLELTIKNYSLLIAFAPLLGSVMAGLGRKWGRTFAHTVAIAGVALSFIFSCVIFQQITVDPALVLNAPVYTWAHIEGVQFEVGFLIDRLSSLMMVVVTAVSLLVHIYTIGYMKDDPGYQRFFSYIALFTFAMLMLVMSNNCLQLFFGWEAVGLVSYLLIGFWYEKESAIFANLKAFLVNRIGDFGFLLGIAAIWKVFGSLDYAAIFGQVTTVVQQAPQLSIGHMQFSLLEVMALSLFVGAMGKSAQIPLHVWLPDSMEGPTPISALIHAATMVTAGVFMVARFSPIFEHAPFTLSCVLMIGALTSFFMGLLGLVQQDIKRIIAYSTLSQLGYMVAALGVSAYGIAIFHLTTHAFFKALLFLGAGSVIMGMHHEQNIMRMGGLWRYMPVTYICMWVGTLALIGFPFFSGFYSKDFILMALEHSQIKGIEIAYPLLMGGVFVTAFYSFRLLFLVFHTQERFDTHTRLHIHESPSVIVGPLVALAIPSVLIGALLAPYVGSFFGSSIVVSPLHPAASIVAKEYPGFWEMALEGGLHLPFWLAMAGAGCAWLLYCGYPKLLDPLTKWLWLPRWVLLNKYGFDIFNEKVIIQATKQVGLLCWRLGDRFIIDNVVIHGTMSLVRTFGTLLKKLQNGYLYQYALLMIVALIAALGWMLDL